MTEANIKIERTNSPDNVRSRTIAADLNLKDGVWDANLYRAPDYHVYIYTVSDREFLVQQPPLFPRLIIRARNEGERYSLVLRIPSPFPQTDREGAVGDIMVRAHVGERVAQSICNPNNPSLNQDASLAAGTILGLGVDLNAQGVFWSLNNPPTEEEIAKAEQRREKYYRFLLEQARTLEISNPKELESLIHQDYHMAAEYFHQETSWHRKFTRLVECPYCGEQIKPGIAAHQNSLGGVCILDEARAAKMGLKVSPAKQS